MVGRQDRQQSLAQSRPNLRFAQPGFSTLRVSVQSYEDGVIAEHRVHLIDLEPAAEQHRIGDDCSQDHDDIAKTGKGIEILLCGVVPCQA